MCKCQIEIYDYEFCNIINESKPIARKQHTCNECCKTIEKGEQYKYEITIFHGKLITYKTCIDCLSIRENLFCSFEYGDILDSLDNEISQGMFVSEDCISKLTPSARERVCGLIEQRWI